jgi:hypothetical protein
MHVVYRLVSCEHCAMNTSRHVSETPATQFLKQHKVPFTEHTYDYVDTAAPPRPRGR